MFLNLVILRNVPRDQGLNDQGFIIWVCTDWLLPEHHNENDTTLKFKEEVNVNYSILTFALSWIM